MSDEDIVFHCAPTLAGIKSGSLFSVGYTNKDRLMEWARGMNRRLTGRGLRVLPLRCLGGRALVYVYRPGALARDLAHPEARRILAGAGYRESEAGRHVAELARRLERGEGFPHEIGLFLGYPPEDVRGFMEHGGRDCKCAGAWKVYGDEESARRTFARYKRCTAEYCRMFCRDGRSLEQLTVEL